MSDLVPADDPRWAQLSAPFAAASISRLPKSTCKACIDSPRKRCDNHNWVTRCSECGGNHSSATIHLDYIGHAEVTARLDEVDPHWTWEPAYRDVAPELLAAAVATGNPQIIASVQQAAPARYTDGGLWIRLTVLGVTRLGFGDAQGKQGPNAVKELIGDAIRNAAMRFGVATYLWSKSEAAQALKDGPDEDHDAGQQEPERPASAPRQQRRTERPSAEKTAQAIAEAAARTATGISAEEALAELRSKTQQSAGPLNVRAAVSDAELAAAAAYYPPLQHPRSKEHLPLWGWLDACFAVIRQNGTSVRDAAAIAAGEPVPTA